MRAPAHVASSAPSAHHDGDGQAPRDSPVSKKKKKKPRNLPAPQTPHRPQRPAFEVGSEVRVRAGVRDPDQPDMPIGGWCGIVVDVDESVTPRGYLVQWDPRT